MPWLTFADVPSYGKRQHNGVGPDWSMRVGTWEGGLRKPLSAGEIAETAGWPRPYQGIGPLTDAVRKRMKMQRTHKK